MSASKLAEKQAKKAQNTRPMQQTATSQLAGTIGHQNDQILNKNHF